MGKFTDWFFSERKPADKIPGSLAGKHHVDYSDCPSECAYSLVCMTENRKAMAEVPRLVCDVCHRQWVHVKGEPGYVCIHNQEGYPDPRPWVCNDCYAAEKAK